jgi:hypothetical protein
MSRSCWNTTIGLLAVVLFTTGASRPAGCSGQESSEALTPSRRVLAESEGPGGRFFLTGQAPDFHAVEDARAGRLLARALGYVRAGSPLPFLWVESRMAPPEGHRAGKHGLRAAGLVEGQDFLHMDAGELAAQAPVWWSTLDTRFSAIAAASDRALLTQAELDQLHLHRAPISRFLKAGGGVLALAQSGVGVGLTQRDRYKFLPFPMWSRAGASPPLVITPAGQEVLGLEDEDVASPAYNHFLGSFGYTVAAVGGPSEEIITLLGQVTLGEQYLFAHAGVDKTFFGPGERIEVTLDGSGSSVDPSGEPLRYVWMMGDQVLVDTPAPVVQIFLPPGAHEIQLVLYNNRRRAAVDEVVITAVQRSEPHPGAPTIVCPASMVVPTAPRTCGAQVYFPPPAVSAPRGVGTVSCSHLTGSVFAGGATPVTCTVVDQAGQSASCGFTVTVEDQEPPALIPPEPSTSEADGSCQAVVTGTVGGGAQVSDNCTPAEGIALTQSPPPGATVVGAGTHVIQLQATDAAGNSTTATTTHTLVDVTPPIINSTSPSQDTLWPPDHRLVRVGVDVDATDNCAGSGGGGVQCHVTHVTSNEPINGPGDGNTRWDWEIVGPLSVKLRAERAGPGNSRIYTVWVSCADASGHTRIGSTNVTVPHDQRPQ